MQAQKRVLRKWDKFLAGGPCATSEDANDKVSICHYWRLHVGALASTSPECHNHIHALMHAKAHHLLRLASLSYPVGRWCSLISGFAANQLDCPNGNMHSTGRNPSCLCPVQVCSQRGDMLDGGSSDKRCEPAPCILASYAAHPQHTHKLSSFSLAIPVISNSHPLAHFINMWQRLCQAIKSALLL